MGTRHHRKTRKCECCLALRDGAGDCGLVAKDRAGERGLRLQRNTHVTAAARGRCGGSQGEGRERRLVYAARGSANSGVRRCGAAALLRGRDSARRHTLEASCCHCSRNWSLSSSIELPVTALSRGGRQAVALEPALGTRDPPSTRAPRE